MMYKLPDKPTVYFDIDDTLAIWPVGGQPAPGTEDQYIVLQDAYGKVWVKPHQKHIAALKKHKAEGLIVVAWSQGGADWVEVVVKGLGLTDYVDLAVSKPTWFYDDLPSGVFMPEAARIYKEP
jgi:phosphoglycolate phosphatase-like HAD superfamily hydrolase